MFRRVIPSWGQIKQFKQPLPEGEENLLTFVDAYLKRDVTFQGGDLTKYDGWLIFVQPFLNGSRPDFVLFNPQVGVQIIEVKDWNLDHYSFEARIEEGKSRQVLYVRDSRGKYP